SEPPPTTAVRSAGAGPRSLSRRDAAIHGPRRRRVSSRLAESSPATLRLLVVTGRRDCGALGDTRSGNSRLEGAVAATHCGLPRTEEALIVARACQRCRAYRPVRKPHAFPVRRDRKLAAHHAGLANVASKGVSAGAASKPSPVN